ncbi:MAG: OmpH family outer membrane protein [Phycisphaerae bacterium]|nr:OmpH family outer membrane protein [Phycisphaerae bacterium]
MKRSWLTGCLVGVAIGAVCFTTYTTLHAQNAPVTSTPVAGLDVVRVFNQYQRQLDLNEELTQIRAQLESENTSRRQRIETMQAAMAAMDPQDPTFRGKRDELVRLQVNYKNWADLAQAQMANEVAVWSGRVYEEILSATRAVAKNRGLHFVINLDPPFQSIPDNPDAVREQIFARRVLFSDETVDVTEAVLAKLNADYGQQPRTKMMNIDLSMTPGG